MSELKLPIDEQYYLSVQLYEKDVDKLVEYLNDDAIYNNTLMIPKHYTRERGLWYLNFCKEKSEKFGRAMAFQIRNSNHELIGCVELLGNYAVNSHKDEIGYWIGKPYRGKGIMKKAIVAFTKHVSTHYKLMRLEACVYDFNLTSQYLIEKCGFNYEGTLKKAYFKDGNYIDAKLYAFVN